jgi:hypothetical protein
MTKLGQALEFIKMGIAVIPLRHRGKEPASHMMGGTWERYKSQLPTSYDVENWLWSGWQNYGVVAGWQALTIIDFDDMDAFGLWTDYFAILNKHTEVCQIPFMVKTGRGVHVYLHTPGVERVNKKLRGVDVKMNGYVVGPLSIHPGGATYQPINAMVIPIIYSLETLLPSELFPPVAVSASDKEFVAEFIPVPVATEYDAFASASIHDGGDLIAKVKAAIRIETLFPDRKQTSGDGRWWAARCPFHDDNHPSAWIDTRRQLFGCEVCNFKPLDVINLYSRQNHITDAVAIVELGKKIGAWA